MQNVNFNSIIEFFEYLPEDEREISLLLQDVIKATLPQIKEKLSYNVPFYKLNKTICFIWPASIFWGKTKSYDGVRLGFTYGYLIDPNSTYLDLGNRKYGAWIDFKSVEEIDVQKIVSFLNESAKVDESSKR